MSGETGILGFGAYVPRHRLQRRAVVEANAWFVPGLRGLGKGHRSFANWDEDAVTMAVEAARDCLKQDRGVERVWLASTTLPFEDRNHAGIVCDALSLGSDLRVQDLGGSRRAATTALLEALESPRSTLVIASECRDPKPGVADELQTGHGAAAFRVGAGDPVAVLRAAGSRHDDLVDRYRADAENGDYVLEERWVRDEGLRGVLANLIRGTLADAGVDAGSVTYLVLPIADRQAASLARSLGLEGAARPTLLDTDIGMPGAAHAALGLSWALGRAAPGDRILVAGFGQGADVLLLEARPALAQHQPHAIDAGATTEEDNYVRYLALRSRLSLGLGIRFERDSRTAMSAFHRKREDVTGFVGGRCPLCGTLQFPATAVCVACRARVELTPESLADLLGRVKSFTEDWQAATPRPPLMFGSVDFPGDATVVMEFTDCEPGSISVGDPVRMMFRIKDVDDRRHFRRYFWKPAPALESADG
ncbi:MAG: zinc ribbon domain-containing protein [Pseudomonadota bacterium]